MLVRLVTRSAVVRRCRVIRELAAVFQISKSAAHRIVATTTPKLAALARESGAGRGSSTVR